MLAIGPLLNTTAIRGQTANSNFELACTENEEDLLYAFMCLVFTNAVILFLVDEV